MATFRHMKGETPFTRIESASLQESRLSWKARGLLAYMLSKPDNFKFHLDELTKHAPEGLDSVKVGIKELELFGYVKRYPVKARGKIVFWVMDIYEVPQVGFPLVEKPLVEKPLVENPMLITNDLITNDLITNEKDKKTSSRQTKIYAEDNLNFILASYLHEKIMEYAEGLKVGHLVRDADLQKWSDEFRKLVELDKRDKEEVRRVIEWSSTSTFWQRQILSPVNLRKKYVKLCIEMAAESTSKKGNKKLSGSIKEMAEKVKREQEDKKNGH